MDKLKEIKQILNSIEKIDLDSKVKELKKKFKIELKGFKYVTDANIFLNIKKKYVRYVEFNNKINYGGFFFKAEKKNNTIIIYLINSDKKVWSIDANKNYIFINDIITENDRIRQMFENYLQSNP
jgi:hypothetical protein